jgi:hypothetical protein
MKKTCFDAESEFINEKEYCFQYGIQFICLHILSYQQRKCFFFNCLLICTTLTTSMNTKTNKRVMQKKRKMIISLSVITFAFVFLTLPSSIEWGYFLDWFVQFE